MDYFSQPFRAAVCASFLTTLSARFSLSDLPGFLDCPAVDDLFPMVHPTADPRAGGGHRRTRLRRVRINAAGTRRGRPQGPPSIGQRQQLAIARTLLTKPRLLVRDEPTEGIQPNVVAEIEAVIADLTRRGDLTVLLVEQHVGFALRSTDSYYVLESGRITGSGQGGEAALDEVRAAMAV